MNENIDQHNTEQNKPLPFSMIRITLYATRLSDLRRQIENMKHLGFKTYGNMEIVGFDKNRTTVIQHMYHKPSIHSVSYQQTTVKFQVPSTPEEFDQMASKHASEQSGLDTGPTQ